MQNRRIVLKSRPQYLAGPENFELQKVPIPELVEGTALVEVEMVALSAWQGMRTKDFRNFIRPFRIGELISCDSFGRIVQSRCPELKVGTCVVGRQGWQDYAVVRPEDVTGASNDYTAEEWLTALSSPGQTPYLAFWQKVRPLPGETLVVSAAAGAVGSYAVQLGKIAGMKVVGIAGGPERCQYVREKLGADCAINYREGLLESAIAAACPKGVNIYFDLTGGPVGDAVMGQLAPSAHVLLVGRIASNNSADPERDMANLRHFWSQQATMHAFSRYAYKDLYPELIERLGVLLRAGKLRMHNQLLEGMERTPGALNEVLRGKHIGKVLIRYRDLQGKAI